MVKVLLIYLSSPEDWSRIPMVQRLTGHLGLDLIHQIKDRGKAHLASIRIFQAPVRAFRLSATGRQL